MTSRLVLAAVVVSVGCASGARQTDTAAAPAADCGGRYAITVRNEGNTSTATLAFTDAELTKPGQYVGRVAPKDEMTFFIRSAAVPAVWVTIDEARVFINDRTAQQRYRVRMSMRCDAG